MSREDINDIINAICPNDEDYEKPCISPKYLRQELEQLALDQEQWNGEPTTKNDLGVDCISRKAALDITWHDPSYSDPLNVLTEVRDKIRELPSVTPQPCEDAVSRQEVLDLIADYDLSMGQVVRGIHALPSVTQEPRWIPVSEYLPVTNDEVLVTYIVNGNTKKRYVETANCFDGEWSSVNDEYRIPNTKVEIIAWCEMPKPYKAETEEI